MKLLSTLIKESTQAYYNYYFETNWNNIKNTRKGIIFLISLKTVSSSELTYLSLSLVSSIVETTKSNK